MSKECFCELLGDLDADLDEAEIQRIFEQMVGAVSPTLGFEEFVLGVSRRRLLKTIISNYGVPDLPFQIEPNYDYDKPSDENYRDENADFVGEASFNDF